MIIFDEIKAKLDPCTTIEPCGSRITCNPPVMNTDQDFLIQLKNHPDEIAEAVDLFSSNMFEWEGGEHYQMAAQSFMSWRKGDVNLIVTANADFADRHRAATHVCKTLNIMNKDQRIMVFQAVLYGKKHQK